MTVSFTFKGFFKVAVGVMGVVTVVEEVVVVVGVLILLPLGSIYLMRPGWFVSLSTLRISFWRNAGVSFVVLLPLLFLGLLLLKSNELV